MSLFARPVETRGWRLTVTNPRNPAYWVEKLFGGGDTTASGIRVSPDVALTYSAVFDACRILAEDIGTLPFHVFRRLKIGREPVPEHPVDSLLSRRANPEMSAIDFRQTLQGHAALRGNGYAEIQIDQGGRPIALWPLRPDKMRPFRNGQNGVTVESVDRGALMYRYTLPSGQDTLLAPSQVFHLRGWSPDGIIGYSVVAMARESIGLGLAAEQFGGRFFGNDARPGAVLEHPGKLSDTAIKHLRDSWEDRHRGLSNAQRMAILEEGMKITEIGVPPEDAQFLQTREHQVTDVSRWFRLAPHLLGDLSHATFTNIEEQGLNHVAYTLRAWGERWEGTVDHSLLEVPLYSRLNFGAFLRGNVQARYESYSKGMLSGFLNGDTIAELEDRNPPPDGQGAAYYVPQNMVPAAAFDEHGMTMKDRLEAVAKLTKAGFDPKSALAALNLPVIDHTGVVPTNTVSNGGD